MLLEGAPEVVVPRLRPADTARSSAPPPPFTSGPGLLDQGLAHAPRLLVLILRYARQWLSSPLPTFATLLLLPLLLGLLVRLAVSADGRLGTDRMLFGLIASFWLGMNQSVREIVRERDIFLREHASRVGAMSVLLSKLFFFVVVALPQAVLLSAPIKWLEVEQWQVNLGLDELNCSWTLLIAMFWLADLVGCAVGLAISSGCLFFKQKGEVVAVLLVILVTLPQILFSAKILPEGLTREPRHFYTFTLWHETACIPELCSFFTVTRYLFLPLDAATREVGPLPRIFVFNLTILAMFVAVTVIVAWLILEVFVFWSKRVR